MSGVTCSVAKRSRRVCLDAHPLDAGNTGATLTAGCAGSEPLDSGDASFRALSGGDKFVVEDTDV